MEDLKEKIPIIIVAIIAIAICGVAIFVLEDYKAIYYTQVDNNKIEKVSSSDDMKYEYTLDCYNEKGTKKEVKFKTSRELKEDAYLMLEIKAMGVHSWKEVNYNELPEKVKKNYNNNE